MKLNRDEKFGVLSMVGFCMLVSGYYFQIVAVAAIGAFCTVYGVLKLTYYNDKKKSRKEKKDAD